MELDFGTCLLGVPARGLAPSLVFRTQLGLRLRGLRELIVNSVISLITFSHFFKKLQELIVNSELFL